MEIAYTIEAQADLEYWKKKGTDAIRGKISQLIESISETPYSGVGKPEPLRYELAGLWSRRIDRKNRIIYSVSDDIVYILSMKGHYNDK